VCCASSDNGSRDAARLRFGGSTRAPDEQARTTAAADVSGRALTGGSDASRSSFAGAPGDRGHARVHAEGASVPPATGACPTNVSGGSSARVRDDRPRVVWPIPRALPLGTDGARGSDCSRKRCCEQVFGAMFDGRRKDVLLKAIRTSYDAHATSDIAGSSIPAALSKGATRSSISSWTRPRSSSPSRPSTIAIAPAAPVRNPQ
jgi:hypothetical protein